MSDEVKLSRMEEYYFAPYFPMAENNYNSFIKKRKRDDLPDDAQVHRHEGYWTMEELYRYGALPPIETGEPQ